MLVQATGLSLDNYLKARSEGITHAQIDDAARYLRTINGFTVSDVNCLAKFFVGTSAKFRAEAKQIIETRQGRFSEDLNTADNIAGAVLATGCPPKSRR
jgi:hypothetical protein